MAGLILLIFGCLVLILYILQMIRYALSFHNFRYTQTNKDNDRAIKVSMIVPFRNEAKNLPRLLEDIRNLDYPAWLLEVILVNDHSEDESMGIINSIIPGMENISLIHLPEGKTGKKAAVYFGIDQARGQRIIQTDADCSFSSGLVREHLRMLGSNQDALIAGPVLLNSSGSTWNKMEALEFMSLTGSAAGAFLSGSPVLCNGANLSYGRDFYMRCQTELNNIESPSGDDIFLLMQAKKQGLACRFILSGEAVVSTMPTGSFRAFIVQRIRWGSKARLYTDFSMVYLTLLVVLVNGFILGTLLLSAWDSRWLGVFGISLVLKSLSDFILLRKTAKLFDQNSLLWYFPLLALFYYFYLVITGFLSLVSGYSWKGRKY